MSVQVIIGRGSSSLRIRNVAHRSLTCGSNYVVDGCEGDVFGVCEISDGIRAHTRIDEEPLTPACAFVAH